MQSQLMEANDLEALRPILDASEFDIQEQRPKPSTASSARSPFCASVLKISEPKTSWLELLGILSTARSPDRRAGELAAGGCRALDF